MMQTIRGSVRAAVLVIVVVVVSTTMTTYSRAELADPATVAVGDRICFEGYIMDRYCINLGTLLDTGDVTLEYPDRHSVHCLIDVSVCRNSEYEILGAPPSGNRLYTRAFQVDNAGKVGLQQLAAQTGAMNPSVGYPCSTCTGEKGTLDRGFRAQVYGIVTALSSSSDLPPTIRILDATASHDFAAGTACSNLTFPVQNPAFGTGGDDDGDDNGATAPTATVAVVPTAPATTPTASTATTIAAPATAPVMTLPTATTAAPPPPQGASSSSSSSSSDEKSNNNNDRGITIVKVLALLAFSGVCALSLFGSQLLGGRTITTTKPPATTTMDNNNTNNATSTKKAMVGELAA